MRTKQILLFGLVTCSLTGNMACKDADSEKTLCIDNVRMISRVTGDPLPGDTLLNPNNTGPDFDVYGTDLGLMWHMDGNRVGMFFGDTSGEGFVVNKNGGNGSNWRSNVLAFSSDTELTDGLKIDSMLLDADGKALEVCAGGKTNPEVYQTSIPTSAIRAGKTDCVHIMNIYDWGAPHGRWLTNFSSVYTSNDDGRTWERREEADGHDALGSSVLVDPDLLDAVVGPVDRLMKFPLAGVVRCLLGFSSRLLELLQPVELLYGQAASRLAQGVVAEVVGGKGLMPPGVVPAARHLFGEGQQIGVVFDRAEASDDEDELVSAVRRFSVDIAVHVWIVFHGVLLSTWPGVPGDLGVFSSRRRSRRSAPWSLSGSWNKKHDRRLLG